MHRAVVGQAHLRDRDNAFGLIPVNAFARNRQLILRLLTRRQIVPALKRIAYVRRANGRPLNSDWRGCI